MANKMIELTDDAELLRQEQKDGSWVKVDDGPPNSTDAAGYYWLQPKHGDLYLDWFDPTNAADRSQYVAYIRINEPQPYKEHKPQTREEFMKANGLGEEDMVRRR